MRKFISSKKAFTLVELVIAMAVISILIGIALGSFTGSIMKYKETVAKEKVLQAKNSYFATNDIDLSSFSQFYFVYEDNVFKGDVHGNLTPFDGFDPSTRENMKSEVFGEVTIYHPANIGYYSIQTYFQTDIGSSTYELHHTDKNLSGYIGSFTAVEPQHVLGYAVNLEKTAQTVIGENPSENIVKVYYNKLPKVVYTKKTYLETDYLSNTYDVITETFSEYLGEVITETPAKKPGFIINRDKSTLEITIESNPDESQSVNLLEVYYNRPQKVTYYKEVYLESDYNSGTFDKTTTSYTAFIGEIITETPSTKLGYTFDESASALEATLVKYPNNVNTNTIVVYYNRNPKQTYQKIVYYETDTGTNSWTEQSRESFTQYEGETISTSPSNLPGYSINSTKSKLNMVFDISAGNNQLLVYYSRTQKVNYTVNYHYEDKENTGIYGTWTTVAGSREYYLTDIDVITPEVKAGYTLRQSQYSVTVATDTVVDVYYDRPDKVEYTIKYHYQDYYKTMSSTSYTYIDEVK